MCAKRRLSLFVKAHTCAARGQGTTADPGLFNKGFTISERCTELSALYKMADSLPSVCSSAETVIGTCMMLN